MHHFDGVASDAVLGAAEARQPVAADRTHDVEQDTTFNLLSEGVDVNASNLFGVTPLHSAALRGQEFVVRRLLGLGALIDARDCNDQTPLHAAARRGHLQIVRMLHGAGAEMNVVSFFGTPLHSAAENGRKKVVQYLLSVGAEINAPSRIGNVAAPHSGAQRTC